jgi:hypothetical protein
MLYTVRPLERIYADPAVFDPAGKSKSKEDKGSDEAEYREVLLPNGRIVTRRDGESYVIENIFSTDMHDYINEDYFPGRNYKE